MSITAAVNYGRLPFMRRSAILFSADVTFVIAYSRIPCGGITGAHGAPRISIDKVYQLPTLLFFLEVFYEQVL